MTRMAALLIVAAWPLAALAAPAAPATAPTPRPIFKQAPDQATVLTATFLGGGGHEWLVGGGWQPDGSVVLVGNVLGPVFDLPAPAQVIGADAAPPPPVDAPKVELGDRGRPFPLWTLPGATGFVVRCTPDLQKVLSVHRLPWTSGTITAAVVDRSGAVYVGGVAAGNTPKLGGKQATTRVAPADPKQPCDHAFIARLASGLAKCEWLSAFEGPTAAPQIRLLRDGTLWWSAQDVRRIDSSGKTLAVHSVVAGRTRSVSAIDGLSARAANRGNWSTGREPWKCPGVRIASPDGTDLYHLYEWDGRYVGLDNHRSVADTTVMMLNYDYDGNLLLATWSDGGNTVMRFGSQDIRRFHGFAGLGFQRGMTGYNIAKLSGHDYNTIASTRWQSEGPGGGGLMRMQSLVPLADGNILISGSGGPKGINQTSVTLLPDAPPQGNFVAVLAPNLAAARFSSLVGGAGEVDLGNMVEWGSAVSDVQGAHKVLLVTGAMEESEPVVHAPAVLKTPTKNAMQAAFGGGAVDGYAIVLDLPEADPATLVMPVVKHQRLCLEARAVPKRRDPYLPPDGTIYYFHSDYPPRHVNADAEFRDARDTANACGPSTGQSPASEPVVKDGLSVVARPSRAVFGPGDDLEFDITLRNVSDKPIALSAAAWELKPVGGWQCRRVGSASPVAAVSIGPGAVQTVRAKLARDDLEYTPAGGKPSVLLPSGTNRAAVALGTIVTAPMEFRVAPYWPSFLYGKSASGEMKWQGGRLVGAATVACPTWVQVQGDQSRRVLGEWLAGKAPEARPPLRFTLSDLGDFKLYEASTTDAAGREIPRSVQYVEGKGKLELNGRTLEIKTRSTLTFSQTMPDNGAPGVAIETFFTIRGRELGLNRLADDEVDVRIGMRGTLEKAAP